MKLPEGPPMGIDALNPAEWLLVVGHEFSSGLILNEEAPEEAKQEPVFMLRLAGIIVTDGDGTYCAQSLFDAETFTNLYRAMHEAAVEWGLG